MSDAKSQSERSMEEIIASISRMIDEDGRSASSRRSPPIDDEDDILELTEAIDDEGRVRPIRGPAAGGVASTAVAAEEPTEPNVRIEPAAPRGAASADPGPIVSPAAAQTAAAAFGELAAAAQAPRAAETSSPGIAARSLEQLVQESLRPLLREWLDRHLPAIVERLVREEIARVAGAAGPR